MRSLRLPHVFADLPHRSVHNTRIERLWYDVTHGFGQKWKDFFLALEANCGLNPQIPAHIWLLHHLFLAAVNQDAQDWAAAWNDHKLQIRGEPNRSPRDIFYFSMFEDGPRGLEAVLPDEDDLAMEDLAMYGIDWQAADDQNLMAHLLANNPQDAADANPFISVSPATLSDVPCEPPNCPFTPDQVQRLDSFLAINVNLASRSMQIRRTAWDLALQFCTALYDEIP